MKLPVYESHDGEAYDGFIKVTRAEMVPTRNGLRTTVINTHLTKVHSRHGYSLDSTPCNVATLSDETLQAIVCKEYDYKGDKLPLYNLNSRAYSIAQSIGVVA